MSGRRDKTLKTVRYLTGHTGIPNISWTGPTSMLMSPRPYTFDMSTERSYWRLAEQIQQASDRPGISTVIRYTAPVSSPADAWAITKLETYTQLLATYYEVHHKGVGE